MAKISYAQRIKSRIKELEQQLSRLTAEIEELRVADRVISRLGDDADETADHDTSTPTIADHIMLVLGSYGPLTTPELYKVLVEQYRPNLSNNSVGATLSRMRPKGLVDNKEGKWFILAKSNSTESPSVWNGIPPPDENLEENPEHHALFNYTAGGQ